MIPAVGQPGVAARSAMLCGVLLSLAAVPADAADDPACAQVVRVLEKLSDRMPEMTASARASRMGVVMLGSSASLAASAVKDAGWSDKEVAPLAAMRDAREPDPAGKTLDMATANALFAEQGLALAGVVLARCPAADLPDLSALETGGGQ